MSGRGLQVAYSKIASGMCGATSLQKTHCLERCISAKGAYHSYFGIAVGAAINFGYHTSYANVTVVL